MESSQYASRLMVLMFTDLVDSTATKAAIGAEAFGPLIERQNAIMRDVLAYAKSARVIGDTGDGYFVAFDSVSEAVATALRFQFRMSREPWPHPIAARVGLHLGQVAHLDAWVTGQPKVFAAAVDLASRVSMLARGGQVLLTRAVFDEARQLLKEHPAVDRHRPAIRWVAHGPYLFKGADEPMEIFEVGAEGVAPLTPPPDGEKARRHIRPGEEQTLGWRPGVGLAMPTAPHWVICEKLGEGGFGEVWLARHQKSDAKRVFKFCFDAERLRALKREVVLFRLTREALGDRRDIGRVIDWQFDAAPYFIEMDYTPEGNLVTWARRHGGIDSVPLGVRVRIVARVADALAAAHSVGILHKDLKPSNVLMVNDAAGDVYPRLTDFGIGILTDRSRLKAYDITATDFTASGISTDYSSRTGTLMYSPPESLTDKPHTVQGDVYALGVLLYQMVVADLHKPLATGWERHVADELLREDVAACVDGDPAARLRSAHELARRLGDLERRRADRAAAAAAARDADDMRQRATRAAQLAERRHRLNRVLVAGVGALAVVAGVIAVLLRQVSVQERLANQNARLAVEHRTFAEEESRRAHTAEEAYRQQLVAAYVDQGVRRQESGDPATALLHFVRALELERGDTAAAAEHRARITAALATAPRAVAGLEGQLPAAPDPAIVTPDGRFLKRDGDGRTWNVFGPGFAFIAAIRQERRINQAAFSPDGTRVATAGTDHTARLWDARTGEPVGAPMPHKDEVHHVHFSPDGRRLVTAGKDKTARVWSALDGEPVSDPLPHDGPVVHAEFDQAGARVVTAGRDQTARVWDVATSAPLALLRHRDEVKAARFSDDGRRVLTVCQDGARVWDVTGPQPNLLTDPLRHDGNTVSAEITPDGARVVTAGDDHTARVWSVEPKKGETYRRPPLVLPHQDNVFHARFSPDGTRVITSSRDKTARVWDADTGRPLSAPLQHREWIRCAGMSPDGRYVVTAGWDMALRVWDVGDFAAASTALPHASNVLCAAVTGDGLRVVSGAGDAARVWDVLSARPLTPPLPHDDLVLCVAFSPDGRRVLTGSVDRTARLWDADTGQPIGPAIAHPDGLQWVGFSADGRRLLTVCRNGAPRAWDADTRQAIGPPVDQPAVIFAQFSDDGRRLFTATDKSGRVWDVDTGKPVSPPIPYPGKFYWAALDADGKHVVLASDWLARVHAADDGHPVTPPMRHEGPVQFVTFSPDGASVATASWDKTARVWDARTGDALTPSLRHGQTVRRVAFSGDGRRVATASEDRTARAWSVAGGLPITPPLPHAVIVERALLSADGGRVVTWGADQAARAWDLSADPRPVDDLRSLAEVLSGQRLKGMVGGFALNSDEFNARWRDLRAKYPMEFMPAPTPEVARERSKHPAAAAPGQVEVLAHFATGFARARVNDAASELLEFVRTRGHAIDPALLARCYWQLEDYPKAEREFEAALDQSSKASPATIEHLRRSLAAVRRARAQPTAYALPHPRNLTATVK